MPDLTDTWWVIRGTNLRQALQRAHDGEDPGVLYLELWANSEHEDRPKPDSAGEVPA